MNYTPLRNLVLLKAARTEEKSEGGIYIPEQARDTLNEGCIVAIGPDVSYDPDNDDTKIHIGDTVVFAKHSEWRVEIDGEVYIAVAYENLLLKKKS